MDKVTQTTWTSLTSLRGLLWWFFFFKQKTAYEIASCLVGSEMCIRDSLLIFHNLFTAISAVAAFELPPPKPAPIGIFFRKLIFNPIFLTFDFSFIKFITSMIMFSSSRALMLDFNRILLSLLDSKVSTSNKFIFSKIL